jgi:hypothetical protein
LILFLSVLIFEDAWKSVGSRSFQFSENVLWKWKASSKNNVLRQAQHKLNLPSAMGR